MSQNDIYIPLLEGAKSKIPAVSLLDSIKKKEFQPAQEEEEGLNEFKTYSTRLDYSMRMFGIVWSNSDDIAVEYFIRHMS